MYMKNFGEFYDDQVEPCVLPSSSSRTRATVQRGEDRLPPSPCWREKNPTATIVTTDVDRP